MPNWTYLVAISTGMLTTLPSVYVNLSSSGKVGLVPGLYVLVGIAGTQLVVILEIRTWSCDTLIVLGKENKVEYNYSFSMLRDHHNPVHSAFLCFHKKLSMEA